MLPALNVMMSPMLGIYYDVGLYYDRMMTSSTSLVVIFGDFFLSPLVDGSILIRGSSNSKETEKVCGNAISLSLGLYYYILHVVQCLFK
jgi:hypothetical protein